jgi:predicted nucleic acid-binding protein
MAIFGFGFCFAKPRKLSTPASCRPGYAGKRLAVHNVPPQGEDVQKTVARHFWQFSKKTLDDKQNIPYNVLMDILLDASAIMAIILNEANKKLVIKLTKGSILLSPAMISYEIGNALISLYKRHKLTENDITDAYNIFKKIPIRTLDVDMEKAVKISCKYNIYAYDAYYLETAKRLMLPLITFDKSMKNAALDMGINVLTEEQNEGL